MAMARGRSNELLVFIDSTGRTYALPAHAAVRAGAGEPLTGRLNPPSARPSPASRSAVRAPPVLASSAGRSFVARLEDLVGNKAGKVALNPASGALMLPPTPVGDPDTDLLAAVTTAGRLLVFPVSELPSSRAARATRSSTSPRPRSKGRRCSASPPSVRDRSS